MTSIIKIGKNAFKGCAKISSFAVPTKTYYVYHNTDADASPLVTTNVLDLSTNQTLTTIRGGAFQLCPVDCAILPNNSGTNYQAESVMYVSAVDKDEKILNDAVIKFVGDTAYQADQYGGNATVAKKHYPLAAFALGTLSNYGNVYYRVHSTSDLSTVTAGDVYLKYWTAIKTTNANEVKIIMFDNKTAANTWLTTAGNTDKILHNFY